MGDGCLSPAQYARRIGVKVEAVYKQLASGRLPATRSADGKWRIRPEETLGETFDESVVASAGRSGPPVLPTSEAWSDKIPDIEESKAARQFYLAKLAEAEYLEKANKLVPLEGIELRYANDVADVRNKILGLPSRLKSRLRLSAAQYRLVVELVEEALASIADASDDTGASEGE